MGDNLEMWAKEPPPLVKGGPICVSECVYGVCIFFHRFSSIRPPPRSPGVRKIQLQQLFLATLLHARTLIALSRACARSRRRAFSVSLLPWHLLPRSLTHTRARARTHTPRQLRGPARMAAFRAAAVGVAVCCGRLQGFESSLHPSQSLYARLLSFSVSSAYSVASARSY